MQKIILIVLSSLLVLTLKAQLFNPINWKSESILWSTYTRDASLESSTLRPRMRFEYNNLPMFENGYLYQVANNFDFVYSGYLVQKIDLKTGNELWQNNRMFDVTSNPKPLREYAVSPYVIGGNLGFHIFKEFRPNSIFTSLWSRAIIGKAEYNNNGDSIIYEITSKADTLNRKLFNGLPGLGRTSFVEQVDSIKEYTTMNRKCPQECKKIFIAKYFLDQKGHAKDSIINELEFEIDIKLIQVYNILEDKYLILIELKDPNNAALNGLKVLLVDIEMNIEENKDITGLVDPLESLNFLTFYHYGITNDKFNLWAQRKDSTAVIYTFDTKGKLWEKIELPATYTALSISLPMIEGVGSVVAISDFSETQLSSLKIYQSDGKGNLTLKEDLMTDNPDDRFNIKAMFWTPDKNLLLHLNQIHVSQIPLFVRQDYHCNALLDTRKLGIITSTYEPSQVKLHLYPNPTTGSITIGNLDTDATITISDIFGKYIKEIRSFENEIDISELSAGVYIFDIQGKNLREKHKVVKME